MLPSLLQPLRVLDVSTPLPTRTARWRGMLRHREVPHTDVAVVPDRGQPQEQLRLCGGRLYLHASCMRLLLRQQRRRRWRQWVAAESRHGLLVLSSCAPNRAAVLISSGSSLPFWRGRLLLWRGWSRRCICLSRPDGPAKQSKIDVYCADATYVATTCVGCKWSTKASTVPRHNIR